nr:hypothetical protein [Tanacetum cinerariifolium]
TVTNAQLQTMIDQGVTAALAARDALRSTNGDDSHNSGTGVRRTERAARECTYTDFLKCQPLPFKGTEGVASLSQWCERMKSVFHISNYTAENQVKFAICTLHSVALTWWNTHVQTVGHEAAYGMSWKTLMKMMTDKYCPRNEIRKLERELWELKVKGTDLASYTQHFQELALLCRRMFSEEADKIEKYVGGLPDMIYGSVVDRNQKRRETASKRKLENTSRTTRNQQQQQQHSNKRQNIGRVYTIASGGKKQYGDPNPYALNAIITTTVHVLLRQKSGCYECGVQGHFKRECPKLKNNNNQGNQGGRNNAPARTIGINESYEMPWKDLMKLMIEVYCPRIKTQKLENELWNLCVKGTEVASYTRRFQELTLLCPRMIVRVYAARNVEQKRKFENNPWGNHVQQPPFKRQNVVQAITNLNRGNKADSNDARGRAALGGGDSNPDSNVVT